MKTLYVSVTTNEPRDYRAERDALRLRLDDALDAIAELRVELAYLSKPLPHVCSYQSRAKAAEARLRSLSQDLLDLSLRAAVGAPPEPAPPAPKWPAVGDTAPWATVWDHLKAEPRARYEAKSRRVADGNGYSALRMVGRECVRGTYCGGEESFCDSRGNKYAEADWTYTRLPDAEAP